MPVVEKAIETAALMLGTDRSRGLLFGNDLRGLPGWSQPRQWEPGNLAVLDDEILQVSARRAAAGILGRLGRKGIMSRLAKQSRTVAGGEIT
jgi:hypothetical protein